MARIFVATGACLCACFPGIASAQDSRSMAAQALSRFIEAWNTADNEALRETLNYPHLSLIDPGQLVVAENPEDFSTDFDRMRADEDWVRSELRIIGFPKAGPEQVHVEADYSRYNAEGDEYRTGHVYYIVTKQDGHWGMQFRMPFVPDGADPETAHEAERTIDRFFEAWNAADNDAIHEAVNFPHAFILPGGRAAIVSGPEDLITDFDGMRERERWHHSDFHGLDITHADAGKAVAHLTFTRHHDDAAVYRTVPVVWIITRQDGHWGVQVRAIFPAIESAAD